MHDTYVAALPFACGFGVENGLSLSCYWTWSQVN